MKYSKDGLYIAKEEKYYRIGLSEKGQDDVGDVIYADPRPSDVLRKGDHLISLEGGKAVSDIEVPLGGRLVEYNKELADRPEALNSQETSRNWIVLLSDVDEGEYQALEDESGFQADAED